MIGEKNILESNDLLLVTHLDELLSRESIYLAKHCHLKQSFVHAALIMPMGNLNFAFRFLFYHIVFRFFFIISTSAKSCLAFKDLIINTKYSYTVPD